MIFERAVRPWLFRLGSGDAEEAHEWTLKRLAGLSAPARAVLKRRYTVSKPVRLFGVDFANPVGLAAGMDKDGTALAAWPALGFGFVEVGTVTRYPQEGNERPRLFRKPDQRAVINRMGFNNLGAAALAERLGSVDVGVPLGISLGKSKVTALEEAVEDYRSSYETLRAYGDYFAINVSSPNTPGLRRLQDRSHLDGILTALKGGKPILVKIAPDLTEPALAELLEVCQGNDIAGLIATNTTIAHNGPPGGLSGAPLARRALEVVSFVHRQTGGRLPVIGVGGIMSVDDANRMFDAGASLIQLYTGFVYHGPALVRSIAQARM